MKKIKDLNSSIRGKKILFVYPHPDDETVMAGGLIQQALSLGCEVTVLVLTEGLRGKIHVNGKGRSVSEIRRKELAEAMSILGVRDWVLWRFEDGRLRRTKLWQKRLEEFVESTKPEVAVSYDLSGVSGHPDHIALARFLLRLWRRGSLERLVWTSFNKPEDNVMVSPKVVSYLQKPNYTVVLDRRQAWKKWFAVSRYKSQRLEKYIRGRWWYLWLTRREEWYAEALRERKYRYRWVRFRL